jgi:hypothetical protein
MKPYSEQGACDVGQGPCSSLPREEIRDSTNP